MESCHKLPLEDGHDREPLPWFGGDDQERPADDAAAEAFDSLKGVLPGVIAPFPMSYAACCPGCATCALSS